MSTTLPETVKPHCHEVVPLLSLLQARQVLLANLGPRERPEQRNLTVPRYVVTIDR